MTLEEKTAFPTIDSKELGKLIQIRRKQLRLNQKELSKSVRISRVYLSLIETNHKDLKNINLLNRISKELEIPTAYLLLLATERKGKYERSIEVIQNIIKGEYFSII